MYEILLGVIGCYGAAVAVVHLARLLRAKSPRRDRHYILVTRNDESRLESCIRSLLLFSRQSGTSVRITVFDQGSSDDTAPIAMRQDGVTLLRAYGMQPSAGASDCNASSHTGADTGGAREYGGDPHRDRGPEQNEGHDQDRNQSQHQHNDRGHDDHGHDQDAILWVLRNHGIVSEQEYPVMVDLNNPQEWLKLPF